MSHPILIVDELSFPDEVLAAGVPVLVEFSGAWCGPCRALEPVLQRLSNEANGRFKVAKVDMDDSPRLVAKYGVRGAPTVMVFVNGEERGRHLGLTRHETLAALLERAAA
jgi:thioredoxin 1